MILQSILRFDTLVCLSNCSFAQWKETHNKGLNILVISRWSQQTNWTVVLHIPIHMVVFGVFETTVFVH